MRAPWVLVAGDLTPLGGMDSANHALARHLAARGAEVHLVTHRAWPDLEAMPGVRVHGVWRPFGRHVLAGPLLARAGHRVSAALRASGARVVVNGGNCAIDGANWVHYVHAGFRPDASRRLTRAKTAFLHRREAHAERAALHAARVVICNSHRTRRDVVDGLGVPAARVHVVYYGSDPERFGPATADERSRVRGSFGWDDDRPLVGFVGALGDHRKGFDTLFDAWVSLCARRDWDVDLVVVGAGAELGAWRRRAAAAGLDERIRFLGFRTDVPQILGTLDALVHPARYEAYGLSVHEALCRGIPALVSAAAGIAEAYPRELEHLLIADPESAQEVHAKLLAWRQTMDAARQLVEPLSAGLRQRSWDTMAAEIARLVEQAA